MLRQFSIPVEIVTILNSLNDGLHFGLKVNDGLGALASSGLLTLWRQLTCFNKEFFIVIFIFAVAGLSVRLLLLATLINFLKRRCEGSPPLVGLSSLFQNMSLHMFVEIFVHWNVKTTPFAAAVILKSRPFRLDLRCRTVDGGGNLRGIGGCFDGVCGRMAPLLQGHPLITRARSQVFLFKFFSLIALVHLN